MSNHFLKRNPDNEPVCNCGYRPDVLDDPAPVGQQWKAKTAVLDHVKALKGYLTWAQSEEQSLSEYEANIRAIYAPATDTKPTPPRPPDAPFRLPGRAKFPRAGVRQTEDGRWLLSCWDADRIVHVIDEPVFDDRLTAFDYGYLTIGACRQSGTNLNGWATV